MPQREIAMNTKDIVQKLRRLHTLLVLGKRSNNLALAIRRALDAIATWPEDVHVIIQKTPIRILFAGYGPKFIKLFEELVKTGDIALIHQLQPEFDPFFCYLCEIPGIGETMARRMFFDRSIRSMNDLRIAYSNSILQRIPSFGDTRLKAIEDVLWISQTEDPPPQDDSHNGLMPSQLSLAPAFAALPPNTKDPSAPNIEYTQSYAQSFAHVSPFDEDDEDDLFTPTARRSSMTSITLPSPSRETPRSSEFPHTAAKDLPSKQRAFSDFCAFALPKAPDCLSQTTPHTIPVLSQAAATDIRNAISQSIDAQNQLPQDNDVKSQLEAFIERDLREHGLLPENQTQKKDSDTNLSAAVMPTYDAERMAPAGSHSEAKAAYEDEGRIEACHENKYPTPETETPSCPIQESDENVKKSQQPTGTTIRVENLHATEIIADELVVTMLKADILAAEHIKIDRRMPEMPEDTQTDMRAEKICASIIYADSITAQIITAKTVRARYIITNLIRG